MMTRLGCTLPLMIGAALAGCASIDKDEQILTGRAPVCTGSIDLGTIYITLVTDWRSDQKAPQKRKQMAEEVIDKVFRSLPCGDYMGLHNPAGPEADTFVEITLREFGPEFIISAPVLWSMNTDVDATIRIVDMRTNVETFAASQRHKNGGAFSVRPLSAVPAAFESMLNTWLIGPLDP